MSAKQFLYSCLPDSGDLQPLRLGSAYGCAAGMLLAELSAQSDQPIIAITATVAEAELLESEVQFFLGHRAPLVFSDPETLAYDAFSPHQDLSSRRLETLSGMLDGTASMTIVAAPTLFHRLPPLDYIKANTLSLEVGQTLDIAQLQKYLTDSGYERVSQVGQHGEFAVRGALLDLFPMGSDSPLRIDFFDNEIDTLRYFDPDTQISDEQTDRLVTLPARDFPTTPEAVSQFRTRFRERFEGNPNASVIYKEVSESRYPGGIENYLPLFFNSTCSFWDYVDEKSIVVALADIESTLDAAWTEIGERYEQCRHDIERPALAPDELFIDPQTHAERLKRHTRLSVARKELPDSGGAVINLPLKPAPALMIRTHAELPAADLVEYLKKARHRTLICAESAGRRETLVEMLRDHGCPAAPVSGWQEFLSAGQQLAITVAPIDKGLLLPNAGLCVIAEHELFGSRPARRKRRRVRDPETILNDLSDLHEGTPVVHIDYGVGRYKGLSHFAFDYVPGDFLTIEYAGGDLLHVPVSSLQLVTRYTGASIENAPLHRLGTDQWDRARRKAAEQLRDVAAEMLDLYATRAARGGRSFTVNLSDYELFCEGFPFELTEDQARAIDDTLNDLRGEQSMDRLVCGDVGFGKTEVALRAAFTVAVSGSQVAILAPTTLLAQQHFQTFSDRFADWPVRVEVLSRFRTPRETRAVIEGISSGKVDIVIGTHKLLQDDIRFADLGLVIVDEEHRFGVRQKERLKSLRAEIDILTLTATPIPRTLNMAMGQLRELSLITTPPESRLAIKTFVTEWNAALLREAAQRELKRGGQIYFVHNRIEDIEKYARQLAEIVPDASIRIAHGQMREQDLEQIMLDFYHRRIHILVCTAIIESGIDVPSANTIIINRADRFGLAQLHQLRGRVGRSHHKAFAYLLTGPERSLTADARKRLAAIEAMEDLGAGFVLATHDLEIRGAGELLGEQQTGQIQQIGFSLYTEMLGRAVQAIRKGETPDLEQTRSMGPEVNLRVPALLPEDYLPDVQMRLVHYKRIASADTEAGLRQLQEELVDRFGSLPGATHNLFRQARLRLRASSLGVAKIEASAGGATLQFEDTTAIEPMILVELLQSDPEAYKLSGSVLRVTAELEDFETRFLAMENLIGQLKSGVKQATNASVH
ncbi:MAG: transcription-repair coupling factor [Gammaproteobacteria bacterium]|jgi:transcription-repair coupling factor (superfamily II helicase)